VIVNDGYFCYSCIAHIPIFCTHEFFLLSLNFEACFFSIQIL